FDPSLAGPGAPGPVARLLAAATAARVMQSARLAEAGVGCDLEAHPAADGTGVLLVARAAGHAGGERAAEREALTRLVEQQRLAIGAARMFFWDWDIRDGTVEWSEGLEEACGLPRGAFGGTVEAFRALVHPADLPRVEAALRRAVAGEVEYEIEFRMLRGDGGQRWVLSRATVLRDSDGGPRRMVGIDLDITDRKLAEEALRESRERLRLAEETARFGIWEWDSREDRQVWSAEQYRLHGLDPDARAPSFAEYLAMVAEEDRETLVRAASDGFRRPEGRYQIEFRLRRGDGETRRLLALARVLEADERGQPLRLMGVNVDVTELREGEQELGRMAALLRAIGECSPDAIYAKDRDGRMLFANPATLAAIGRPLDEVLGRTDADWHVSREQADAALAHDRQVLELGAVVVAEEAYDPRGLGTRVWRSAKAPLRDGSGNIVGTVGISSDITEAKRTEAALRAALASREMLVREADHRIKNSLQLAAGLLRLQARRGADPGSAAVLEAAVARVMAIAEAHRTLYQSEDFGTVDLCQILKDLAAQADGSAAGGVTVRCDMPPSLPLDAERAIPLGLVANELVMNAVKHAYPPGHPGLVRVVLEQRSDDIVLRVADNGVGLGGAAASGRHGLGTTLVRTLTRQIGATFSTKSAPGAGTAATLVMARARSRASDDQVASRQR
ncbi:MAG TPA: PAS domain-containing protein, partial [Acetobacteraceae bacterium]|nr:PAS domain-containing protein [Acetobacteraceae bacterium]